MHYESVGQRSAGLDDPLPGALGRRGRAEVAEASSTHRLRSSLLIQWAHGSSLLTVDHRPALPAASRAQRLGGRRPPDSLRLRRGAEPRPLRYRGVTSSRKIESATWEDVATRVLAGDQQPQGPSWRRLVPPRTSSWPTTATSAERTSSTARTRVSRPTFRSAENHGRSPRRNRGRIDPRSSACTTGSRPTGDESITPDARSCRSPSGGFRDFSPTWSPWGVPSLCNRDSRPTLPSSELRLRASAPPRLSGRAEIVAAA